MKKVKIDFEKMTVEEAIDYCYEHQNAYLKTFDNYAEGKRQFECLIEIIDLKVVPPSYLPKYGMNF